MILGHYGGNTKAIYGYTVATRKLHTAPIILFQRIHENRQYMGTTILINEQYDGNTRAKRWQCKCNTKVIYVQQENIFNIIV